MKTVVYVYSSLLGTFVTMEKRELIDRMLCFQRLKKARHHKVIAVNDALKVFGFRETELGNSFIVDDIFLRECSYYVNDKALGCERYYLEYAARPIYEKGA